MDIDDDEFEEFDLFRNDAEPAADGPDQEAEQNSSSTDSADDEIKKRRMGTNGSRANSEDTNGEQKGGTAVGNNNIQGQKQSLHKVTFNRSLPAEHTYLGRDLEEIAGGNRSILEDEAVIDGVPIFPVPNLVLMPGQVLPMQSLHPRAISMFRAIISRSQMFGVVNVNVRSAFMLDDLSKIGTLTQVLAFKEATEHDITSVKLRAIGRERFEILETHNQIDGSLTAKIRIRAEVGLDFPLADFELPSLQRLQATNARISVFGGARRKQRKYFASALTPWPWFIYKQYDMVRIIDAIKAELRDWYDEQRIEQLSKLPLEFSYWVAANLPLDNDSKLHLLNIDCVLKRLHCELSLIKKFTILICRGCSAKIGEKAHLFSMSLDGVIGAFVNPHGFVHETITLTEAVSVSESGHATTENSWFPGYAWTIINCAHCGDHLGWKFESRRRHLKPKLFYGISRANILPSRDPSVSSSPEDEDDSKIPFV